MREGVDARERLLNAAYDLFAVHGVNQVGVDAILARSGCAKASLYNHFNSKTDLALAFLDRRETKWTHGWLEREINARAATAEGRLLAIFDVFDGWFRKRSFEGCSFINVLLESDAKSPVRRAAAVHLAKIRGFLSGLARDAGLREPEKFAQAWQMLMKGAIVTAGEGQREAAQHAKRAAELLLDNWPRLAAAKRPESRRNRPSPA